MMDVRTLAYDNLPDRRAALKSTAIGFRQLAFASLLRNKVGAMEATRAVSLSLGRVRAMMQGESCLVHIIRLVPNALFFFL